MMNRVEDMNRIFLWTVLMAVAGSLVSGVLTQMGADRSVPFLVSQVMLALPLLFYMAKYHVRPGELLRFHKIKLREVLLLILFAFFITPFMNLINAISLLFTDNVIEDTAERIIFGQPLIFSLFIIAFVPCLLEEIVYRGAFYNEYRKTAPVRGLLLSAFLFGAMHLNLNQFFYAFMMGILFALLVECCDSILASMIVHFTINARSVLTVYLEPAVGRFLNEQMGETLKEGSTAAQSVTGMQEQITGILSGLVPAFFSTAIAVVIFITLARSTGRQAVMKNLFSKKERTAEKKEPLSSMYLWIGVGVCLVLIVGNELIPG